MTEKDQIAIQTGGKCTKCKKSIDGPAVVITASYGEKSSGTPLARHVACLTKNHLKRVNKDTDSLDGFGDLEEDDQEELKTQINDAIEKDESKKAEKKGTKRKAEPSEKKSKKKSKDSDDESDDDNKKKKKRKKDPNAPRKNQSPYMFFSNDKRPEIQKSNPGLKITEISKVISEKWKVITADEKKKFEQLAASDKERYAKQQKEFDDKGFFTNEHGEKEEGAGVLKAKKAAAARAEAKKKKEAEGGDKPKKGRPAKEGEKDKKEKPKKKKSDDEEEEEDTDEKDSKSDDEEEEEEEEKPKKSKKNGKKEESESEEEEDDEEDDD